jgi:predicted O-methyltransferase YrrM
MKQESAIHPHHPAERAELFSAHDNGSIEVEYGDLLTALVRAWKPEQILETGTYRGIGARYLAEGCVANGFGRVVTLECIPRQAEEARTALAELPVEVVCADSVAWLREYDGPPFQFAFLDSALGARVSELRLLRDRRLLDGIAFVHDTSRLRAAGGMPDRPNFTAQLDELGLGGIECPWSRGWRIFQMHAAAD